MNLDTVFNKESINTRAKENWNYKDKESRLKCGNKYRHIFSDNKIKITDWSETFERLTKFQQNILIKGELIRTYDALPNIDKTEIKNKFGLSTFSTKWYKLPSSDRKILLKFVI